MTATAISAADILREIERRQISIVPSFDGKFWTASVDEFGASVASKRRKVRMISATASTPQAAVAALIQRIDEMATPRELFGDPYDYKDDPH